MIDIIHFRKTRHFLRAGLEAARRVANKQGIRDIREIPGSTLRIEPEDVRSVALRVTIHEYKTNAGVRGLLLIHHLVDGEERTIDEIARKFLLPMDVSLRDEDHRWLFHAAVSEVALKIIEGSFLVKYRDLPNDEEKLTQEGLYPASILASTYLINGPNDEFFKWLGLPEDRLQEIFATYNGQRSLHVAHKLDTPSLSNLRSMLKSHLGDLP